MPRKVSEENKKEFVKAFFNGLEIKEISSIHKFSVNTISKQLRTILGKEEFENIKSKNTKKLVSNKKKILNDKKQIDQAQETIKTKDEFVNNDHNVFEVVPIATGIEFDKQKDLVSEPFINANLPEVVYMLVDKKIELEPKFLKEYPDWSFMPDEDQNRLTLEIYDDQKIAKKICSKNQKLIKVPNSQVFLLASSFLKSKGITRIIFNDSLLII